MPNYILFIYGEINSYLNKNFFHQIICLKKGMYIKMKKIKCALFWFVFLSAISFASISSFALPNALNISSNTSGNIANGGHVLKYDGWVYYSFDSSGLYRMKEDGSQKKKIHNGWYANLTAYEGYIYGYCKDAETDNPDEVGLFRMKPDGTESVRVSNEDMKDMEYITIYDGWVYYTLLADNYKPHKMKLDGTNEQRLNDYPMSYMNVTEEWIYFESHISDGDIYKMKHDGSQVTEVTKHSDLITSLNLDGDWLYFYGSCGLFKIKTDGSGFTELYDGVITKINVKDDWIYFSHYGEGIYKIKTDGTGIQKLRDESEYIAAINLTDEWLYYEVLDYSYNTSRTYRIKFDGSNNQKFKITEDHIPDEAYYVKIRINGEFSEYSSVPLNLSGRILLPFREVLKNLGVPDDDEHIIWDGKNKTVTIKKDDTSIFLTIGKNTALVNGEECELDVAPLIHNGRTFIPTRFIAQSLNKKVLWDGENEIVSICEQADFEKVKGILEATNSKMVNNVQNYRAIRNANLKYKDESLNYELELKTQAEIDSKNRLFGITDGKTISRDYFSGSWNDITQTVEVNYCYQNGRVYVKNDEYAAWEELEVEDKKSTKLLKNFYGDSGFEELEITEKELADRIKTLFCNYSFVKADEDICASFTVDETEDHYVLKGDYLFWDLAFDVFDVLNLTNEKINSVDTELLIDKKEYHIEKIDMTINGECRPSSFSNRKFDIVINIENKDFNSETVAENLKEFNPIEIINPEAFKLADFVSESYLYIDEVENFKEKTREFILKADVSFEDVEQYINAIKTKEDIYTYCIDESEQRYEEDEKGSVTIYDENYDYIEKKDLGKNGVYIKPEDLICWERFVEELEKIEERNEKTLVIDLRDNRLGFAQSAYSILDYMLPESIESFFINGDRERVPFYPDNDCRDFEKILILVNENTVDVAELFALGLKKHLSNTTIIGCPTRGNGHDYVVYWDVKRKFSVCLVCGYWDLTQYGITDGGVTPDIIVTDDSDYMKEVEKLLLLKR